MFFCDSCAKKCGWPSSIMKSHGKCEMCENVSVCNDVPSRYLPPIAPASEYVGKHRLDKED